MLKTIIAHDNEYEILHSGNSVLTLPDALKFLGLSESDGKVELTLKEGDSINKVSFSSVNFDKYISSNWIWYRNHNNVKPLLRRENKGINNWYKFSENDKTMYFYYGNTTDQKNQPSIKKVVKEMFGQIDKKKSDKVIIDLRENTGGNYHKSKPLIKAIKERAYLRDNKYIFVLVGRKTFSAALITSIHLKKEIGGVIIGEPSRGHPNKADNVEYMNLPHSGLRIEYTIKVKKHWPEIGNKNYIPIGKKNY